MSYNFEPCKMNFPLRMHAAMRVQAHAKVAKNTEKVFQNASASRARTSATTKNIAGIYAFYLPLLGTGLD